MKRTNIEGSISNGWLFGQLGKGVGPPLIYCQNGWLKSQVAVLFILLCISVWFKKHSAVFHPLSHECGLTEVKE